MSRRAPRLLPAILLACLSAALSACGHGAHDEGGEPPHVSVSHPVRRDVELVRRYVCQIHAARHIELRALERGYLESVEVAEGQAVRKGQTMFNLLPVTFQAELARARAEADATRIELENTRRLADQDIVAPAELALAQAKFEKARADVSLAQAHLDFTRIRAPFDGLMDRLLVREGSLVDEGELLTTLSDNARMWVYFNVPEAEYLDFMTGAGRPEDRSVELLMANGRRFAHSGRVAAVEAEFNHETGTIPFRADFPNPDRLLRHGQTGNVLMKRAVAGALLIPQRATFEVLDHHYVFVVRDDGTVAQRQVEVGDELEDLFLVTGGLEASDRIVVDGVRQVHDGQHVEPREVDPAGVLGALKSEAE